MGIVNWICKNRKVLRLLDDQIGGYLDPSKSHSTIVGCTNALVDSGGYSTSEFYHVSREIHVTWI